MKTICIIVIASMGLLIKPAVADDKSARALADKLIEMTDGKGTLRAGFEAAMNGMIQNMAQHGLPPVGVAEVHTAVDKWYDEEINFAEIKPKIVDIYIKNFSEDELKQIAAFYGSPAGQKAIKTMPLVMREGAQAAQEYTTPKIPLLNAKLTPILTKYQSPGGAGGAGPGSAPAGMPPGAGGPPPAGN